MHHFTYRNGVLHAEDVPLPAIAEAVGTPFYCYSTATLTRHYQAFSGAFRKTPARIFYSVKANSNLAVIATLRALGAGADVVSGGELKRALAAGIPASDIVFSGVGKSGEELALALDAGIHQFNVESEPELAMLSMLAAAKGRRAPVAIRVNPDVDAKTHDKIATGKAENKFGISWQRAPKIYAEANRMPGIEVVGIDVHIGSQLTDLAPFEAAFARVGEMVAQLRADGIPIVRADLGGGLGVPYRHGNEAPPHPDEYAAMVDRTLGHLDLEICLEPGRLIAANAGILVSSVIYEKHGEGRNFLILDAAMNDLIRPTLYDAHHDILAVEEAAGNGETLSYDVVGPVCESGDFFAKDRRLPRLQSDDLVSIMTAGAYGAVQASTYNTRPLVPEVMVNGADFAVVRPRVEAEELIALDRLPPWLG